MHKIIGIFEVEYPEQSVYRAPKGRTVGFDPSARGAIWRQRVPHNEKKDRGSSKAYRLSHTPRGLKGPANFKICIFFNYIYITYIYIYVYITGMGCISAT